MTAAITAPVQSRPLNLTKAQLAILGFLERVAWSFIQGGMMALPVMFSLTGNQSRAALLAFGSGGLTALMTLAKTLVLKGVGYSATNPIANLVERFAGTFFAAFVGTLPATITLGQTAWVAIWTAGLVAGLAAVFSLAKNLTSTAVQANAVMTPLWTGAALPQSAPLRPSGPGSTPATRRWGT